MQRNRTANGGNNLRALAARLTVVLVFVLGSTAVVWAQSARGELPDPKTFKYRDLTRELANKMAGTYVIATVGDILMQEPVGKQMDPKIQQILRDADTAIGNMEATIIDRRNWPYGFYNNWSPKETAADLKALGFDMLTGANNHTFDMGEEGSRSNVKWLDEAGIPLAGVGPNLSTARMPVFQYTTKGRVGMVGAVTPGAVAAGDKHGNMGVERWGANVVHTTTWNVVPRPQLEYLRGIRDAIVARRGELEDSAPIAIPKNDPDRVQIYNDNYIIGPKVGEYHYEINKDDFQANLLAIRTTKEYSNYAIFTMHTNQNRYAFQQLYVDRYPNQFVIDFAHALIDNGADMYLGHGVHSLQGIEVYKGRPIFYDLGEFVLQEILVDEPDVPAGMTPVEADELPTDRLQTSQTLSGLIATSKYQDGKLVEIRLYPIDLGVGKNRPWSNMAIPQMASPELAQEILTKVQTLSKPFQTKISIENGIGVIRIPPEATVPVGAGIRSTITNR